VPIDVDAVVIANRQLSADYNVLSIAAPGIADAAEPGQFVMVKPGSNYDPLLRRPFSIFEILRDNAGRASGLSLLNKRIGPTTRLIFDAAPGQRIACLGPLGRPFIPADPPRQGWMVAGGVGLAPFVTLAEAMRSHGTSMTLFYGGRTSRDLHCLDLFEQLGCRLVLATEDGSKGSTGRVTTPLDQGLRALSRAEDVMIYACGPERMLAAVSKIATAHGRPSQVSVERIMGCGLGGCYSCVVPLRSADGARHFVRSCIAGPVFAGADLHWD
jgi:dihydroorotate dehydrogenase electron transfer subunit